MPQWSADRQRIEERHPDERWSALCPPEHIEFLLQFDHHVVWLAGRPAVLLTYGWHTVEDRNRALRVEASFPFAPGHPPAPTEVQAVADSLAWTPDPNASAAR